MDWFKKASIVLILVLGLLPRVVYLTNGPDSLVRIICDDAFYYFQTARNIVAGNGSTFDGIHPTNGYHPLWMVLNLPIAAITISPLAFIRLALGLNILFNLVSTLLVYALLKKITDIWWIPLMGVVLYFFNPQNVLSSLSGLETSVSSLFFVISLHLTLSQDIGTSKRRGYEVLLGLSLGLLFLSRTDNVFYVIIFFLIAIVQAERQLRLKRGLILASVAVAVVSPWFIWNLIEFRSPLQSSAFAIPYWFRESYLLQGHSTIQMLVHSAELFVTFLLRYLYPQIGYPRFLYLTAAFCSLLIFGIRWKDSEMSNNRVTRRYVLIVLSLWVGSLFLVFSHTFVRWYAKPWYFDQLILLSAVLFSLALVVFDPGPTLRKAIRLLYPGAHLDNVFLRLVIVVIVIIALMLPLAFATRDIMRGVYPYQVEMLDAAYWLRTNIGEDETAAAFNAGIMAFFSDRRVINLDGAINNAAYAAVKRKDLMNLMYRSSVRYYLDYDPEMLERYSQFLGEMKNQVDMSVIGEIDRPDVHWKNCTIRIYQMNWLQQEY